MEDDITVNDDLEGYVKDDLEGDDLVIDDEKTHMSTAVIDDERTHMSTAVRVMNGGHTAQITDEMMKIRPVVQPTEGAQRALVHTDGASTPVGKNICGTGGELTPVIPLSQYMIGQSDHIIAQMRKGKQRTCRAEQPRPETEGVNVASPGDEIDARCDTNNTLYEPPANYEDTQSIGTKRKLLVSENLQDESFYKKPRNRKCATVQETSSIYDGTMKKIRELVFPEVPQVSLYGYQFDVCLKLHLRDSSQFSKLMEAIKRGDPLDKLPNSSQNDDATFQVATKSPSREEDNLRANQRVMGHETTNNQYEDISDDNVALDLSTSGGTDSVKRRHPKVDYTTTPIEGSSKKRIKVTQKQRMKDGQFHRGRSSTTDIPPGNDNVLADNSTGNNNSSEMDNSKKELCQIPPGIQTETANDKRRNQLMQGCTNTATHNAAETKRLFPRFDLLAPDEVETKASNTEKRDHEGRGNVKCMLKNMLIKKQENKSDADEQRSDRDTEINILNIEEYDPEATMLYGDNFPGGMIDVQDFRGQLEHLNTND